MIWKGFINDGRKDIVKREDRRSGASRYGIDSIYIDNEDGRYLDKNLHTYAVKGNDYDAIVDIILK